VAVQVVDEGRLQAPGGLVSGICLRQTSRRQMPSSTSTMSHFAGAKYSRSAWQAQPSVSGQCSSW
jgi:hypothetical protein